MWRKRFKIGSGVVAGLLCAFCIGVVQAADKKPVALALIQKQGGQQYFVDEAEGAENKAKELGNVKVNVINVRTDSNQAISAMQQMIGQRVDGIAIVAPDQKIGPQVADMAKRAGIPLIAVDDSLKTGQGKPVPFVGFDGYDMGSKVGHAAGMRYNKAGWDAADTRILSVYKRELSSCQNRARGQKTSFEKVVSGQTPKIIDVGTDNSNIAAQNKTGAVITANPGVKHWVVWGCNDESETGAVNALGNAGVSPSNIIGVGLGGYLDCKPWKAGRKTGNKASLYISGESVGATAVETLVNKIRNDKPLPAKTIAKTTIVTPDNWKSVMGSCQ